ncbi:MAG: beta-L-arabinofuranosidase domain-containing protein, partial [Thermoguttaceae bacterium]
MEFRRSLFLASFLSVVTAFLFAPVRADDRPEVRIVRNPQVDQAEGIYVGNRPPLLPGLFVKLPAGSIAPHGWLRRQLELEAQGMAGRLGEVSDFLKWEGNGWIDPKGANGWEEVSYWLKGFGDLGYVLRDEKIIGQSRRWIEGILAAQQPDGWFGPNGLRTALDGKPDMWPHMPILNALQSYHEFTGDKRVIAFMLRYARWQNSLPPDRFGAGYWPRMRFGDNLETVYWLYNRTGEPWLLDLARKIHNNMADWTTGLHDWHNVNVSQCFREPAEYWLQD